MGCFRQTNSRRQTDSGERSASAFARLQSGICQIFIRRTARFRALRFRAFRALFSVITNLSRGARPISVPMCRICISKNLTTKIEYKTANGWKHAKKRIEQIKVRKNLFNPETETIDLEVIETENGVIILEQADKKYALKWTALDPKNDTFEAFYKLNRAKNWDDFKSALSKLRRRDAKFYLRRCEGKYRFSQCGRDSDKKFGKKRYAV